MSDLGVEILARLDHGMSVTEIAHGLGVAQSTVLYHVRRRVAEVIVPPTGASAGERCEARVRVTTRARVEQLIGEGVPRAEIARRLGIAKSTVSYHVRRLGKGIDERCAHRYDWSVVQEFHDAGNGARACIREFGFSSQTWHAAIIRGDLVARSPFLPVEALFAADTPRDRGYLKKRLLALGLRDDACERCGLREWQGASLSMALHHVNGDRDDNRLENLQLLCPNCHSQTDNFAGRRRVSCAPARPGDDGSSPGSRAAGGSSPSGRARSARPG